MGAAGAVADEDFDGPPDDFLDGVLDDNRIYDRALADGEVAAIAACRP